MRAAISFAFAFTLSLSFTACSPSDKDALREPRSSSTGEVIPVERDDAEMEAAMQKARDSFGEFWKAVAEDRMLASPKHSLTMAKAYFSDAADKEGGEHLWIDEVKFDGKEISGVVSSEPLDLTWPKLGDTVTFPLSQLSDWIIVENDLAKGAYTVQLLRSRMTPAERKDHDANYPWSFPDL